MALKYNTKIQHRWTDEWMSGQAKKRYIDKGKKTVGTYIWRGKEGGRGMEIE